MRTQWTLLGFVVDRHMESAVMEFLLSPDKIFCLVSTLFGLKKTDNLYEFKYLYVNKTLSKFPQQNCSFIFSPFLLDCCKIW